MKKIKIINCLLLILIAVFAFNTTASAAGLNTFVLLQDCPLGPDVTKDLSGALRIFKIVAPILCIAFSTIEAVKAVTAGDAATDMKRIAIRFAKRMVYTILIFFISVIVDAAMQLFNVWDAEGQCTFDQESTSMVIPE